MTPTRKQQLQAELQRIKDDFSKMVAQYVQQNPSCTYEQLAARIGIDTSELARHCQKHGVSRPRGPRPAKID
jgi:hypothetical protein